MTELLSYLELQNPLQLYALLGAGLVIGMAKSGLKGLTMLAVPLLALNFGTKASTGLLVPILLCADVLAVIYYRRDAVWKHIFRLIPAAIGGVVLAVVVGDRVNEDTFRIVVATVVLLSLALLIYLEKYPLKDKYIERKTPAFLAGLAGGFTTMIGNVGGPVMNVFLLAMKMPKNQFLGTAAYFFLLINLVKLPFHLFVWETIDRASFLLDLVAIPAILIGFTGGVLIVKRIPEREFRYLVIIVTTIVSLRLLFN